MKNSLLIIGMLFLAFTSKGQQTSKVSENTRLLVDSIATTNMLMGSAIGYGAIKPAQYARFEQLKNTATYSELVALTDHENGVVRCYAIWGLADRAEQPIFDIVKSHLKDNEVVQTVFGCIQGTELVGDVFVGAIELADAQKAVLDSIMLYDDDIKLQAKSGLLIGLEPLNGYYPKVKALAMQGNNPFSFIALSKYQKLEDAPLIENLLKNPETEHWGFRCVQYFPYPAFFNYLKSWHAANISKKGGFDYPKIRVFYKALVQYKTEESLALLERSLTDSKGFGKKVHREYILTALLKYPYDYFHEIRSKLNPEKLLLDESQIEVD